jgi:hypothetical protein
MMLDMLRLGGEERTAFEAVRPCTNGIRWEQGKKSLSLSSDQWSLFSSPIGKDTGKNRV